MALRKTSPVWASERCVVAATGPSLTPEVAEACAGQRVIAVNDAYRLFPDAGVLYAADAAWWRVHEGCPGFRGEKWTCAAPDKSYVEVAEDYGLNVIGLEMKDGFSTDPACVHHGNNSGFQAINLALLFGANPVVLVGFNMSIPNGMRHFFGDHPAPLNNRAKFIEWVPKFDEAAKRLPPGIDIINATPSSALECFRKMELADALSA